MTLPTLRDILNDTPGDATDVDYNFQTLQTYINTAVVNADGSVAMTGPLTLPGAPISDNQAANKAYVDDSFPVSMMVEFGGDVAPAGWALCDGAAPSTTDPDYIDLFGVIGFKFGDPGGGNFNLPDFRKAVAVGVDPGGDPTFDTVGKTGGSADLAIHSHTIDGHTHTSAAHSHTMPTHNHTSAAHTHSITHNHASATTSTIGTHTHNLPIGVGIAYGLFSGGNVSGTGGALIVHNLSSKADGSHSHTLNLPSFSGTSGSTTPGVTGSRDPGDTNSKTPGPTGSTGLTTNDAGTGADNYPLFTVVTKIIKL